jgi:hypothetical protein
MLAREIVSGFAAAALLTTVAAVPATASEPENLVRPQRSQAVVQVRNYNRADVEVYAVSEGGRRFRLGTVSRQSERTLAVPGFLTDGSLFRLKIYTYEPRRPASMVRKLTHGVKTNPLSARSGQTIELIVNDPLTDTFINHLTPR